MHTYTYGEEVIFLSIGIMKIQRDDNICMTQDILHLPTCKKKKKKRERERKKKMCLFEYIKKS